MAAVWVPRPAAADELIVGALRDQDGAVVAGARVEALDPGGRVIAQDRSAADGTFAIAAPGRPAALVVTADDADRLRLALPPAGGPVAAILHRHRAADLLPTAADIAALPAGTLSDLASVVPYRVALAGAINDRWLARGRGVTTVEGMPFYRRGDGADTTSLLPAHAVGGLEVRDPLAAPWYGDRAGGGVVDAQLFDRTDTLRATDDDASSAVARNRELFAATSWDADGMRRLVAAHASGTVGPLSGNIVALLGDTPAATYAGLGLDLRGATRGLDLAGRLDLTRDVGLDGGPRDAGNVTSLVLDARGRGNDALDVRVRWRDEQGTLGELDADHHDAALVFGTARGNVARVSAALALAYGDQHGYDVQNAQTAALAVLPTLALDAPLAPTVTVHAGFGESTLGTPGSALARAQLGELALAYTDHHRLRADVVAYAEGDGAPVAFTRGLAASLGWELAPRLSLRAWALRDGDTLQVLGLPPYPGGPKARLVGTNFQRDVAWLTWDAAARFDLLVRNGALEGGVRVPLGARYALTLGSSRRSDNTRAFTLGLVGR